MNYEMGGTILSKTVKEKDLGVTMNCNMKVSEQCRIAASKAVSTPVPVANRTLAYWALESGLRPHELKIDRPRTVRAQLN